MAEAIATYLNKIRRATYGQEVRGAIADGIEECYRQVTGSEDFVDSVASILEENTTTTVTQGRVGSDAAVDVTREGTNLNFHFTIPQGNTGERGPVGPPPNISVTVHQIDDSEADPTVEVTGDPATPAINLGLPKGAKGDKGDTGSIARLNVNENVGVLDYNQTPVVTVDYPTVSQEYPEGDPRYPRLSFQIPRGAPGTIYNASGETIYRDSSGQVTIADSFADLESRSGFCVRVMLSSVQTSTIPDQRITENHVLTGYRFYDESGNITDLALANLTWTTADGLLTVAVSKVYKPGSVILDFGWRPDITDTD